MKKFVCHACGDTLYTAGTIRKIRGRPICESCWMDRAITEEKEKKEEATK